MSTEPGGQPLPKCVLCHLIYESNSTYLETSGQIINDFVVGKGLGMGLDLVFTQTFKQIKNGVATIGRDRQNQRSR